jgi:L-threonylcarbamoyladenylate synthase
MNTRVLTVDREQPNPHDIAAAAAALRAGELVAFPTETVYGLGANALDTDAVARIFEAKGRPSTNPVIVHVADKALARSLVAVWPDEAEQLAARFWPGPLTLVVAKGVAIPDIVTAGGPTVGIRIPAHPVALALLRAAGIPVAAPSANRSTEVSPTTAAHVLKGLDGRIAMLLDGGPTTGGIESTVLDLSSRPPRLLRPGLISAEDIENIIGPITRPVLEHGPGEALPSPGLMKRHYSPRAEVVLVEHIDSHGFADERIGYLTFGKSSYNTAAAHVESMPDRPQPYATRLYSALHAMDDAGVHRIIVELPPDTPEWYAVRDRLTRAASRD